MEVRTSYGHLSRRWLHVGCAWRPWRHVTQLGAMGAAHPMGAFSTGVCVDWGLSQWPVCVDYGLSYTTGQATIAAQCTLYGRLSRHWLHVGCAWQPWLHNMQLGAMCAARPMGAFSMGVRVDWGLSQRPVCCGQTAGWIKMLHGMEVGLGPRDTVRWGPSSCPTKGEQQPPSFRPMSIVATVAHLSYCWALVLYYHYVSNLHWVVLLLRC